MGSQKVPRTGILCKGVVDVNTGLRVHVVQQRREIQYHVKGDGSFGKEGLK